MDEKAYKALEAFLMAWKSHNYRKMYSYCQLSWKKEFPQSRLVQQFNGVDLLQFKIVKQHPPVPGIVVAEFEVAATIRYRQITPFVKKMLENLGIREMKQTTVSGVIKKVRIIPELSAYKPSENGIFGVNSVSILKIEKDERN